MTARRASRAAFLLCFTLVALTSASFAQPGPEVTRLDEPGGVQAASSEPCPSAGSDLSGAIERTNRLANATITSCGRLLWDDGRIEPLWPLDAPFAGLATRVTIDSMMVYATTFGYSQSYNPGGALNLTAHAERYYLSNGTWWGSGAGSGFPAAATFHHVEQSGDTLRYVLTPSQDRRLYKQIDYDSGDHSSQGEITVEGDLVIVALRGASTGVLAGRGRIVSNDATWYGEPRFNYFGAPVGSIVPFRMVYTLTSGTFGPNTFASGFSYTGTGSISFTSGVTRPALTGLEVRGPRRIPAPFATEYRAVATYEGGVRVDVTDAAQWTVEPPALATISRGSLSVLSLAHAETLRVHAAYSEGGTPAAADFSVFASPGLSAEEPGNWPMYQADSRHSGHLPVTANPARIELLWQRTLGTAALNPVAAGDGRVFCTVVTYFGSGPHFFALDAASGATQWSKDFGSVFSVNPPSYAYGTVYLQTGNHGSDTWLRAFQPENGDEVFKSPHSAQWERYFAPTIEDGKVYVNGGYYGGMYAFDAFTGQQSWFRSLPQYDQWTPAIGGDYAFAYVGGSPAGLYAIRRTDGEEAFHISDPDFAWSGYDMGLAPVVGTRSDVLAIHDGRLMSFDVDGRTIRWQLKRAFAGQPSLRDSVIYAIDNGALVALRERTGGSLWSWRPATGALQGALIVTQQQVFARSADHVYAVDLGTHQSVWSYAVAGHLAIGNNALYVASDAGVLTAFDLGLQSEMVANAGRDTTVQCAPDAGRGTAVRLDGRASRGEGIALRWSAPGVPFDDDTTATPTGWFPLGTTTVELQVSREGEVARDTVLVTVRDEVPPALSLSVEPAMLWPPNHKFVPVRVTAIATDACDPNPVVRLVSIACAEPGSRSCDSLASVSGAAFGEADFDVVLRAEREGDGTGRIYTLVYEATDAAGHSIRQSVGVVVPHDMGRAQLAMTAPPQLTIFGQPEADAVAVEPASIVLGTWDRDWMHAAAGTAVDADVDGDGRLDRTWALEPLAAGSPPAAGTALVARWREGSAGWSAVLPAVDVAAVGATPAGFAVHAMSNPVSGSARLRFEIPSAGRTRLRVFDLSGRLLDTLVDGVLTAGEHEAVMAPPRAVGAQLVFYQLEWMGRRASGRLVVVR